MVVFVVVYGLDWVATVPPTVALCRRGLRRRRHHRVRLGVRPHQVGAAAAALAAGVVRDATGDYTYAWFGAAALCTIAAVISATIARTPEDGHVPVPA